ncbi:hypothetical protein GGR51DRAFT_222007 [Nemania sp. FL0031]|nr:hypothetical protein GGR51DRAFT_222007 [Nemania sp. FL0031]
MQAKTLILSLFLAASVAAVPVRTEGSFNGIGSDNENNPALGTGNANHNGIGNSFHSDNKRQEEEPTLEELLDDLLSILK